jgi:imidazolonepropionase-like amidohydrolase
MNQRATVTRRGFIGAEDRKDSLAVGKDADIVILNRDDLAVEQVFLRGSRHSFA